MHRPPDPNVWVNPFAQCTSQVPTSEAREERILPLSLGEAWKVATIAAARSGIVSSVAENDKAIAFFDHDFYCQVIKLDPAGDRTRVIVTGRQMKGIHLLNVIRPPDTKARPARTLEVLSQEGLGVRKWVDIFESPRISRIP